MASIVLFCGRGSVVRRADDDVASLPHPIARYDVKTNKIP